MAIPYKMKYTNGKKSDTAAFPFKASPGKMMAAPAAPEAIDPEMKEPGSSGANNAISAKIDKEVESKVDEVVNQKTSEGLV